MCSYASRLKLISEEFRTAIAELNSKGKAVIPENVIPHIFLNIRQIYTLSQQILSDLQKRMDNWEEIEEIGDVLSTLAPFLKVIIHIVETILCNVKLFAANCCLCSDGFIITLMVSFVCA